MNQKQTIAAAIAGALIALAPLSPQAAQPAASVASTATIAGVSVLQAEGTVQAVDRVAHTVTVKDAASGQATFNVSPDSTKLSELKAGDKVRVRMVRDAAITLAAHASPNMTGQADQGASGADPLAQNKVAAEVVSVDQKTGVLALRGAKGAMFHIQANNAGQVAHLSAGTHVDVVYAPTANVSVTAAQ
jgi:Cu/Ag efflux protein CusF